MLPGDAGGPVLDAAGNVIGLLLAVESGARELPEGVAFAAGAESLAAFLSGAGLTMAVAATGPLSPDALSRQARGMTVLVSCWD